MTTATLKRQRFEFTIPEGWSAFAFLSLALIMVTWSVSEAGYDEALNSLVFVTFGAIMASLFLAKSRFPGFLAHLLSLVYGVAWNAFVISYQLPKTFTARDRLLELGYRLGAWFQRSVIGGKLGTDPLMFTVVMSILFWLMTYIAMWFTFRAHSLGAALLPSGITLILNLYYGPERIGFTLVPYLLFILLFTVRFNLYTQETSWHRRRVRYDTDIVYSFLRYGATLAVIALLAAWILPSAATSERAEVFFSRFTEPWERVKEEWIRLFSTLQSERTQPSYASFGPTLELGGPVNLGNITLMDVQSPAGRYWRAAVYDQYTGDGWIASEPKTVFLDAGEAPGPFVPYEARQVVTQTFTLYMPGTTQLYALGQPEVFGMPIKASVYEVPGPGDTPLVSSLAAAYSRYKLKSGDTYMVISTVSAVDEKTLRLSGTDLPEWADRYLQLPDDLPQRVRDLALEITAPYDNYYDKAMAIQDYLREYTYNEQIQRPPLGVDRVDYFLFELKEGYCNYYASAMAVLARAAGIPARVAAGYTRGDWESDAQAFRVRQYHSHAWVEIYLPRFGWIEFEPTASQAVIVRPRAPGEQDDNRPGPGPIGPGIYDDPYLEEQLGLMERGLFDEAEFKRLLREYKRQQRVRTWTRVGLVLAASLVIIGGAWWLGRRRSEEERAAEIYYDHMVRRGSWFGCRMQPWYTPNEYAAQLATSLGDKDADRLVRRITDAYVGERYGNKNPARYQPDFAWRDLRPILTRWGIGNTWRRLWKRSS